MMSTDMQEPLMILLFIEKCSFSCKIVGLVFFMFEEQAAERFQIRLELGVTIQIKLELSLTSVDVNCSAISSFLSIF